MKRSLIGLLAVVSLLLFSSAVTLQAAPLNQTTPTAANWGVGALLRVKSTVPFVWLRTAPSPAAGVLDTAPRGDYVVVVGQAAQWDGVQWWWRVRRGNIIGYVEQESMELIIAAPTSTAPSASPTPTVVPPSATPRPHQTTQASWLVGTLLRITTGVPFAWLRTAPSANGQPFDTLVPGTTVSVVGANPQWDGVQWWWQVRRANGGIAGFVEQDSLELVGGPATGTTAVTAVVTVVVTPGAATAVSPAAWGFGTLHSVKPSVPFAWVRTDPSSTGGILVTLYPGWLVLIRNATPVWDGVQWWWQVTVPARGIVGWIEQTSLF